MRWARRWGRHRTHNNKTVMAENTNGQLTVSLSEIENDIVKHLSIIGKRNTDRQGNTMFTNVTLSAAERAVVDQYITEAVNVFAGEVAPVVKTYDTAEPPSVTFDVSRVNAGHRGAFEKTFIGFTRSYVLHGVLEMSNTEQAKGYGEAMTRQLAAAVKTVFDKTAPSKTSGKTLADMEGEIEE